MEELLSKIVTEGGLPMALLAGGLVYVWRELLNCKKNHLDCERKTLILANSIEDLAEGLLDDAKVKAAKVINDVKAELGK